MVDHKTVFRKARQKGASLILVKTPDPASTIIELTQVAQTVADQFNYPLPAVEYDVVRGYRPVQIGDKLNEAGFHTIKEIAPDEERPGAEDPVAALVMAHGFEMGTVVFAHNLHRFFEGDSAGAAALTQAIWNLRDAFKCNRRTLVMLCPDARLPAEIAQDVLVIDEPHPGREEMKQLVLDTYAGTKGAPEPEPELVEKAADAVRGLAKYPAENSMSMAMTAKGMHLEDLENRSIQAIEQTLGLSVHRSNSTFKDVIGLANVKWYIERLCTGELPPLVICWIDELEKAFAGVKGDTSGTSQDQFGVFLQYMSDYRTGGVGLVGPPGAGKSLIPQTAGATFGIMVIRIDLGAMLGSHVGESQARIRQAIKVIHARSGGRVLFVYTSNDRSQLPAELFRADRFETTFHFDLPTVDEQAPMWSYYLGKFGIEDRDLPPHRDWTAAEIRQCCKLAHTLGCTLLEASRYIVPVAKSAAAMIERQRIEANGCYISASAPGVYQYRPRTELAAQTGRKLDVMDD